ncbi:MAG: bacillithiol biosynthesis cysteine-adding enzyme BshC [Sphingobacteriales bacterium]|jgi:bacillithiol biosynthesis cysteine-adding enzyme BshC
MSCLSIPFHSTGYFSDLVLDYLSGSTKLDPFFEFSADLKGLEKAIDAREKYPINRKSLVEVLNKQYKGIEGENTSKNITLLGDDNTFTITTGHQLNIFTGPLYFIYKIASVINLSKTLKQQFPDKNFVPVYWMATEDHDFEEINHTSIFGNKVEWERPFGGAVGELNLDGFENAIAQLKELFGGKETDLLFLELIKSTYAKSNLADATRAFVHELFKEEGLVIVDANDKNLKSNFGKIIFDDIVNSVSQEKIEETTKELSKNYKIQVSPREINFFYLDTNLRERIVFEDGKYNVLNTKLSFSESELKTEIESNPQKFSPNVVMRPLYQESILPNLAYIGGPAEVAYWLELKSTFEAFEVFYPAVFLRDCALIIDKISQKRLEKLDIQCERVFKSEDELIKNYVNKNTENQIKLNEEIGDLVKLYQKVLDKAKAVDTTLEKMVRGEQTKAINHLKTVEQKLIRAEKQHFDTEINQIRTVKQKLFPGGGLQERSENFIGFYLRDPENFFSNVMSRIDVLDKSFKLIY